ncbi:MAG: hypothetical protein KAW49_08550, partial [Anaerolineae bacterium]|nr:hypothetical protein [Anaerolineae bacterium]
IHCSLFIVHCSLFIVHWSLVIGHWSLVIGHSLYHVLPISAHPSVGGMNGFSKQKRRAKREQEAGESKGTGVGLIGVAASPGNG